MFIITDFFCLCQGKIVVCARLYVGIIQFVVSIARYTKCYDFMRIFPERKQTYPKYKSSLEMINVHCKEQVVTRANKLTSTIKKRISF